MYSFIGLAPNYFNIITNNCCHVWRQKYSSNYTAPWPGEANTIVGRFQIGTASEYYNLP